MIFLTRRATFSASHYYWNPEWTEEKNRAVFGRCANRNGHGHNYTLEVTVAGEPDPLTGFVVDLKWLKDVIEDRVLSAWDHRHFNLEVPEFALRHSRPRKTSPLPPGSALDQPSTRRKARALAAYASTRRPKSLPNTVAIARRLEHEGVLRPPVHAQRQPSAALRCAHAGAEPRRLRQMQQPPRPRP